MFRRVPLLCAVTLLIAATPVAFAQEETRAEIALENQLLELRQDLSALQAQVAAGSGAAVVPAPSQPAPDSQPQSGPPTADITAQLVDRVSRLEEQTRTLQGAVDELRNGLQQQNADLSKQIADLTFRVQTLEGGASEPSAAGTAPPQAAPRAPAAPLPVAKPPTLQAGYAAFSHHDYPAAEAAARAALRGPHGYDAQLLLAQAFAGQREYQQAALAFDDTYNKQRTGVHAPDSLAGLAGALAALGDKPAACATLSKLRAEFPAQRPDIKASASAIGRRAACR